MSKKWIAAALSAAALLGLWGCSNEPDTMVYVENVGEITGYGSIAVNDKFAGVVVSEQVTEIQRDTSRQVSKLYVSEGQDVNQGDVLFEYDSEALQLELEKQELELERLQQASSTLQSQITKLTNEQKKASKEDQLSYDIEISSKQAEKNENDYNIKVKQKQIKQTKTTLANAEILSPIAGRIVSISESGMDEYGNPKAYISIQKTGSYRVKGTINEMNLGTITEGTAMRITSRQNPEQMWTGVVTLVDLESTIQDNSSMYYGVSPSDEMTSTSKYPFYVELDSAEGLMLGQHVYLEVNNGEIGTGEGLWLPEYYICYEEAPEEETPRAFVWADNGKERLEKRYVTLGAYDEMSMAYEILDGLTVDDYIAFPDKTCVEGAGATRDYSKVTPAMDGTGEEFAEPDLENGGLPVEDGAWQEELQPGDVAGEDVSIPAGEDIPEPTPGTPASPSFSSGTASDGNMGATNAASSGNLGG